MADSKVTPDSLKKLVAKYDATLPSDLFNEMFAQLTPAAAKGWKEINFYFIKDLDEKTHPHQGKVTYDVPKDKRDQVATAVQKLFRAEGFDAGVITASVFGTIGVYVTWEK